MHFSGKFIAEFMTLKYAQYDIRGPQTFNFPFNKDYVPVRTSQMSGDTSLELSTRRTVTDGPEDVRFRESWLQHI